MFHSYLSFPTTFWTEILWQNIMFTSSMIILLHCWAEGGPDHVPSADQARVLKTMSLLDRWADRWPLAGRYWYASFVPKCFWH